MATEEKGTAKPSEDAAERSGTGVTVETLEVSEGGHEFVLPDMEIPAPFGASTDDSDVLETEEPADEEGEPGEARTKEGEKGEESPTEPGKEEAPGEGGGEALKEPEAVGFVAPDGTKYSPEEIAEIVDRHKKGQDFLKSATQMRQEDAGFNRELEARVANVQQKLLMETLAALRIPSRPAEPPKPDIADYVDQNTGMIDVAALNKATEQYLKQIKYYQTVTLPEWKQTAAAIEQKSAGVRAEVQKLQSDREQARRAYREAVTQEVNEWFAQNAKEFSIGEEDRPAVMKRALELSASEANRRYDPSASVVLTVAALERQAERLKSQIATASKSGADAAKESAKRAISTPMGGKVTPTRTPARVPASQDTMIEGLRSGEISPIELSRRLTRSIVSRERQRTRQTKREK